jgi:hypothetical protein
MKRSSLGGRTARSLQEDKGIPRVSTRVMSSKGWDPFKMYIAAQEWVIGVVLLQEEDGKEFLVAYVSRRLLDAETRYIFMEKLCLSLYYACSKFRHYILSSSCVVACQYDVIKNMLLKPILSYPRGFLGYIS